MYLKLIWITLCCMLLWNTWENMYEWEQQLINCATWEGVTREKNWTMHYAFNCDALLRSSKSSVSVELGHYSAEGNFASPRRRYKSAVTWIAHEYHKNCKHKKSPGNSPVLLQHTYNFFLFLSISLTALENAFLLHSKHLLGCYWRLTSIQA